MGVFLWVDRGCQGGSRVCVDWGGKGSGLQGPDLHSLSRRVPACCALRVMTTPNKGNKALKVSR